MLVFYEKEYKFETIIANIANSLFLKDLKVKFLFYFNFYLNNNNEE